MPLKQGKSDATRSGNIAREVAAGKDPKQAAAIAYDIQRKNRYGDMKLSGDGDGKRKIPALAASLGAVDDEGEGAVDDKPADDDAEAVDAAGAAAKEAFHADDWSGFIRAIAAGVHAVSPEAADMDLGDENQAGNPYLPKK